MLIALVRELINLAITCKIDTTTFNFTNIDIKIWFPENNLFSSIYNLKQITKTINLKLINIIIST